MKYSYTLAFAVLVNLLIVSTSFSQSSVSFTPSGLKGITLNNPTSLQFGPDNRLYVSQQNGTIFAYTIQYNGPNDYEAISTETILLIKNIPNHDDKGILNASVTSRQITGILVKGTPANPVIYVSSSDPRIGGGGTGGDIGLDTNSGIVSKLTWNGAAWVKVDVVIGLPRSEENHSVNGMQLDEATNILYLAVGGHTNAGAPSNNFAFLTEYALSAAILSIDLTMIQNDFGGSYILPTLDDPTRANTGPNGSDVNDPFGGNDGLNQAKLVVGGPVQIHSPGYRNAYDIVITKAPGKEGRMYTIDNGANGGWGGHPDQEGAFGDPLTTNVTNNYVIGEPGSTGPGPNDAKVNNKDNLHLVSKPGMTPIYKGHPNPIRANPAGAGLYWYDNATATANFQLNPTVDWPPVPLSMANPVEGDFRNPGVNDGALYTWGSSTNGIAEYTSNKFFNGAMVGDLLAASFDGSIYRIKLTDDGTAVNFVESLASGFGSIPLDLVAQGIDEVFEGTIWAATYGSDAITIFEPEGAWAIVNSIDLSEPIARHENGFAEANGNFYLIGGRETTTTNIFDPSLKVWSAGASLPIKMHHFQAVTWQNKIYVMGAFTGNFSAGNVGNSESPVANIYIYDPVTNIWSQGPAIPRPRGSAGVVVYNNEFYLISGIVNGHHDGWVNWVDKYNPTTQQWTILADAPQERDHFQAVEIDGKIYLTGGRKTNAQGGVFGVTIPEVDVYDIGTNTWETLPASSNVITQRAGTSSVVLNNEIYLIGGESPSQTVAHKECEVFDPVAKTWRPSASLNIGRHGTGAIVYNNVIYTVAGSPQRGSGALSSMESFTPTSECSGDINNFSLDDDEDGYSNGDETLNGTNPCSASSVPPDFDKDFISDLLDDDDDNDGIPDVQDLFAQDATNGMSTSIPLFYPFLNGDPGTGLFGLGFTGLMSNQTDNYQDLYDLNDPDLIMGGAVGIATVPANSGDAITNDQQYAFQFGVLVNPIDGIFTIESKLQGTPFFDGIAINQLQNQTQGIFIGTGDQDNYLRFSLAANNGNPGLTVVGENGGTIFINQTFPVANILTTGILFLSIEINPITFEASLFYQTGSDPDPINIGFSVDLPSSFNNLLNGTNAMAVGIIASSGNAPDFSASWDYLNISINSSNPSVIADAPTFFNRIVGDPTTPVVIDLSKLFVDDGGVENLTYDVASIEANTFVSGATINNGILTISFIPNQLGAVQVVVNATDLSSLSGQYEFLVQVIPTPTPFLRINTGGPSYASWQADGYFSGGNLFSNIIPIANTTDDILYQTERWSDFTYSIPVEKPGYYKVNLHFAEIYHGVENSLGIGARVFNVEAEGNMVLSNYDIFLEAGGPAKAIIEEIDSVLVLDGSLTLAFTSVVDRAKISAIELAEYSLEEFPNSPPIVQNPGNRYIFEGGDLEIPIVASDFNFGDVLQYQASGLPASLSINPNTGIISGTIEVNQNIFPIVVTVTDGNGGSTEVSFKINVVEPSNYSHRINTGGSEITYGNEVWESDNFFLQGQTYFTTQDITNSDKDIVYQSERFANKITYDIPVPAPGMYNVTLHFAEIFFSAPGLRVFNVDIESGNAFLENYDIFQEAGGPNLAVSESFTVEVTDGSLSLLFTGVINSGKISGIEISSCLAPVISSLAASVTEICAGEPTTITVNGTLGNALNWNLYTGSCGGTLIASNSTGVFEVSPIESTTYFIRGEGGCTVPDLCTSIEINVNPIPDAAITPSGPFCINDVSSNLIAATSGGIWSGPGITDVLLGTFDPAIAGTGSHLVTYSITIGGCTAVDNETIQVNPGPDATISGPGLFCENDAAVNLTAATTGGAWSGVGITDINLGTFDPTVAGSGSHIITYTITSAGCTSISTKTIQVLDSGSDPTITVSGPFCENTAIVTLSAATPNGTWSGPGIIDGSLGTFDPSVAGPGSHLITYSLTAGVCNAVDTETIQVDALPDATITPIDPFCVNDSPTILSAATPGGTWSGTGITDTSSGAFDPSVAGTGSHVITYTVTIGACTSVDTETIFIPDATISAENPVCVSGANVNLTAVTPGGIWSGTGITDASLGIFEPSVAGPGSHVISYILIAGSCIAIDNETIQVDAIPNATINAAGPFCAGDASVTLSAATIGGVWSGKGITNSSLGTFDPLIAGPGSHIITYTISSGACISVDTETLQVSVQPNATITATSPFCTNDPIATLTAASAGGTWSGLGITDASLGKFNPSVAGPGNHVITYTVISGACTSVDTETIKVDAIPNVTITAAGPFCENDASVNLTSATPGGTWSGPGITNALLGTFNPMVAGVGSHIVGYTLSASACTTLETETIEVGAILDVTIAAAGPFCEDDASVNLLAATPGGNWSGPGISDPSAGTFDPAFAGPGNHVITYTFTSGGCSSTDTETIVVTTVNTDITISGNTLTASATGATYQWIDCNGNTDIAGQTGKDFTPEESGSYAVRVTFNGCTSTSPCINVVIVGLQENLSELISMYPNPASSRVTIELPVPATNIAIEITDASGRSSFSKFYDYGSKIELDTQDLSPGMYILHLKASQMAKTIKLVIK